MDQPIPIRRRKTRRMRQTAAPTPAGPAPAICVREAAADDPSSPLEVVDQTGAKYLRYWYFEGEQPVPCLIRLDGDA